MPHQDNSFLYTEPQTCTGLWLALEDATVVNGCLWAIPGSQKSRVLLSSSSFYKSFLTTSLSILTFCCVWCNQVFLWFVFVCDLDGLVRRLIRGEDGMTFDRPSPVYDPKDFVPIEVKAGSLVVIHGDLIHQRSVTLFLFILIEIHVVYLICWRVWKVSLWIFPVILGLQFREPVFKVKACI